MKYYSLALTCTILLANQTIMAATIIQCRQADGSIEFTNKSCSKKNKSRSKTNYSSSNHHKKSTDFLQGFFIQQQEQLLQATTQKEISKQGKIITQTINSYAQQGKLNSAYNMVASVYAKLSKQIKKYHWQAQPVSHDKQNIRLLFENILMTQSMISSIEEFSNTIDKSWQNYNMNTISEKSEK